ncbi:MAG: aspartate aminotransferase family protein [Lachnospiraceae bacterium]|nr:aspartate aminotransferase family protein [Lachnospiraceae bacterium]
MELTKLWRPLSECDSDVAAAERADGVFIYDVRGNRYFDAYSGLWNVNLGYGNEAVRRAMHEQIDRLPFVNPLFFSETHAEKVAEKLCGMVSLEMEKVVFTCTGSEAVEAAIKIARKYFHLEGREFRNIAVFGNSYHGSYYGSMSASNFEGNYRRGYGPLLEGFISLGIPYKAEGNPMTADQDILEELKEWLGVHGEEMSALLIEPVIGSGGVIVPPARYMEMLKTYCEAHKILVICDEIACGFGRTGTMFGFQRFGLRPDIVTVSKGMNNGFMPVGAVCVNRKIVKAFREKKEILFHLSTQNLNPVTMAASFAALEQYTEEMLEQVEESSRFWAVNLAGLKEFSCVREIRICGLMIAIDFVDKLGNPLPLEQLMELIRLIGKNGVLSGDSHIDGVLSCVLLFPPYTASRQQIRKCVEIIKKSVLELFPE